MTSSGRNLLLYPCFIVSAVGYECCFSRAGNVLILNFGATHRLLRSFFHVGVMMAMTTFGRHCWGRPDFQPSRRPIRFRTGAGLNRGAARVMPGPEFLVPSRGVLFLLFLQRLILKRGAAGGGSSRNRSGGQREPLPEQHFEIPSLLKSAQLFFTVEKTQPRKKQDGGTFVLIFPLRVHSVCGG